MTTRILRNLYSIHVQPVARPLTLLAVILSAIGQQHLQAKERKEQPSTLKVVSSVASARPGQVFWGGIQIDLDPGWHTYWCNPGDSGLPPRIIWQLPQGVQIEPLQYPSPKRFVKAPLVSYGYEGTVTYPFRVRLDKQLKNGNPITIEGKARWLVCTDTCIPQKTDIKWKIPMGRTTATAAPGLTAARNNLPQPGASLAVTATKDKQHYYIRLKAPDQPKPIQSVLFFPKQQRIIQGFRAQPFTRDRSGSRLGQLKLVRDVDAGKNPSRLEGVVVFNPDGANARGFVISPAL